MSLLDEAGRTGAAEAATAAFEAASVPNTVAWLGTFAGVGSPCLASAGT